MMFRMTPAGMALLIAWLAFAPVPARGQALLEQLERQLRDAERAGESAAGDAAAREALPSAERPAVQAAPADRPKLGVTVTHVTANAVERYGLAVRQGALVARVEPDGAAAQAGFEVGDVVVAANGRRIDSPDRLVEMIQQAVPGQSFELTYYAGAQLRRATVRLGNGDAGGAIEPMPAPLPPAPTTVPPPVVGPANTPPPLSPARPSIGDRLESTGRPLLGRLGRLIDRMAEEPPPVLGDGPLPPTAPDPTPSITPPGIAAPSASAVDPAAYREPVPGDTDEVAELRRQVTLLRKQVELLELRLEELERRAPRD